MKKFIKTNLVSKLKLINVLFIIFGFYVIDIKLMAHSIGYYSTEGEAKERAKELGCVGIFKLKKMWMPCENEKELHKYLRKN